MTSPPPLDRRFEPRCHICTFIREDPQQGELLEAWLVDMRKDNQEIADYFNKRFGQIQSDDGESWTWKPGWHILNRKKLVQHMRNHVSSRQEIMRRSIERGQLGNITLEGAMMDQLGILDALGEQAKLRIAKGDIEIESFNDLHPLTTERLVLVVKEPEEIIEALDLYVTLGYPRCAGRAGQA